MQNSDPFQTFKVLLYGWGVLLLWVVLGFLSPWIFDWDFAINGQLGDGFGMVSALFNGLGFVALIYTIMLQRETYLLQKQDLDKTHESMELQRSSNALFSMINILENMLQSMSTFKKEEIPHPEIQPLEVKGRDAINEYYRILVTRLRDRLESSDTIYVYRSDKLFHEVVNDHSRKDTGRSLKPSEFIATFSPVVILFFENEGRYLKSYIKYVDTIIDFVLTDFKGISQRQRYLSLFRSQFSQQELALLFYCSFNVFDTPNRGIGLRLAKSHFLGFLDSMQLADMNHLFIYKLMREGNYQ
jgi:hypothetical protein